MGKTKKATPTAVWVAERDLRYEGSEVVAVAVSVEGAKEAVATHHRDHNSPDGDVTWKKRGSDDDSWWEGSTKRLYDHGIRYLITETPLLP